MRVVVRVLVVLGAVVGLASAQSGTIVPNENLVVDGIPPLPTSLVQAVGRYTEFRSATLQSWHPTRREMLISTRFGDTAQIHLVRFPGGARTQLTFFPERVASASFEPRHGEFLVFLMDVGGGEFHQGYRFDLATGSVTLLTDGTSRNSGGVWSTAGDRIAYSSTRRNGKDTDLYVVDPRDPKTDRRLAEVDGGGWMEIDWSPDDRTILVGQYVSINESYLWLFDAATGERRRLTPNAGPEKVAWRGGEFAPDGRSIYLTTDKGSEFMRLVRLDLATGAETVLTPKVDWDVGSFDLSRDGKLLAFVTNEDGVDILHLMETRTGKERPLPRLPVGLISSLEWHDNGRDLGFTLSSARSPADAYSLDVTTDTIERWTESETGGLNPRTFSEPELVRWPTFDGKSISGFLYKPATSFAGRRPVIVDIHGGPEGQARPGFRRRDNYFLNELGVALIFPNVRGSSGYGKTFLKLDNGTLREDSVKDIGALLDWIATREDLDPGRVMVAGGSYGGYMTLAVATHYNERIRCSLDEVGISNFVSFLERTEAYRRDLRRVEYGDERDPAMREFLLSIAPLNHADKIRKPIFIVQGRNDPRVPFTESEQMVATLKKNLTPVWYLLAKDEGHGFAKKKNQDFQFYATVAFIQEFLLN